MAKGGKRGVVLARYESGSREDLVHEVRRGADGKVYCTCESWRYSRSRTCKHLDHYAAKQPKPAKRRVA